jgi:hypothetical protein
MSGHSPSLGIQAGPFRIRRVASGFRRVPSGFIRPASGFRRVPSGFGGSSQGSGGPRQDSAGRVKVQAGRVETRSSQASHLRCLERGGVAMLGGDILLVIHGCGVGGGRSNHGRALGHRGRALPRSLRFGRGVAAGSSGGRAVSAEGEAERNGVALSATPIWVIAIKRPQGKLEDRRMAGRRR